MADLLDVLNAFTMPLKLGWALWVAAGLMLILSYRMLRVAPGATVAPSLAARRPVASAVKAHPVAVRPIVHPAVRPAPRDAVIDSPVAPGVATVMATGMAVDMGEPAVPAAPVRPVRPVRRRRANQVIPSTAAAVQPSTAV